MRANPGPTSLSTKTCYVLLVYSHTPLHSTVYMGLQDAWKFHSCFCKKLWTFWHNLTKMLHDITYWLVNQQHPPHKSMASHYPPNIPLKFTAFEHHWNDATQNPTGHPWWGLVCQSHLSFQSGEPRPRFKTFLTSGWPDLDCIRSTPDPVYALLSNFLLES